MPTDLSPIQLDALLQGAIEPDDAPEVWRALVGARGGAEAWEQACRRRDRLDATAATISAYPWTAFVVRALATVRRPGAFLDPGRLRLAFPDQPLASHLGPDSGSERSEPLGPDWGETTIVRVARGTRVQVVPADAAEVLVWWKTASGSGDLPRRTWRLQEGEAPVLLACVIGADAAGSFDDALREADAAAVLVLVEDDSA